MGILKVPKATTAQRVAITLAEAEVVYDTDLKRLYTGDGVTAGGNWDSLELGETSTTAYRGDRGKIAYDNRIVSLTTTGSSGSASLVSNVLNIPTYTLSGLGGVPYSGASSDLDLGSNNLNAQAVHIKGTGGAGHLGLRVQSSDASASANEIALFADSSGNLKYKYDGTYYVTLLTSGNTANRTYTFQNASGTLAFTSDLSSYTPTTRTISTTAPLSGGGDLSSNRTLSIAQSTTSTDGYLSSTDWNTFNGKQTALVSGTNIKTFAGNSILGSGAITIPCEIQVACSDETTALTTGTGKVTFRMPYAMTVTEVRASLTTAQTSGSIFTVDINENGTSMISTKLTIDNTEKTSVTALTPAVISDSGLADDSEITIDIDQIGDGTAKGLKVTIKGTRTA